MPKCGLISLQHGSSPVNLLHILRTHYPQNTSGGLLLNLKSKVLRIFEVEHDV